MLRWSAVVFLFLLFQSCFHCSSVQVTTAVCLASTVLAVPTVLIDTVQTISFVLTTIYSLWPLLCCTILLFMHVLVVFRLFQLLFLLFTFVVPSWFKMSPVNIPQFKVFLTSSVDQKEKNSLPSYQNVDQGMRRWEMEYWSKVSSQV